MNKWLEPVITLLALLSIATLSFAQSECRCENDAKGHCAPVAPRPSRIVKIDSIPPKADIWEGEAFLGTAPLELLDIRPGDHTFTLKLPDGETTQTLPIKANGVQSFTLHLTEYPKLTVQLSRETSSDVRAMVTIDEHEFDFLPTRMRIAPGKHRIRVHSPDHLLWKREIEITTDTIETISLVENVGYLDVGTTNFEGAWKYSNLVGVNVEITPSFQDEHLLPHERGIAEMTSQFYGTTPVVRAKLRPGKYTVSLRPERCEKVEPITQEVSIERGQATWVPARYAAPLDRPPIDAEGDPSIAHWEKRCYEDSKNGYACLMLGYDLSHRELSRRTEINKKAALKAYERACKASYATGCLEAAYLARDAKLRECRQSSRVCTSEEILAAGAKFLELALDRAYPGERPETCWYGHVVDDVDPTASHDLRLDDSWRKSNTIHFEVTALGGFAPWLVEPRYAELGIRLIPLSRRESVLVGPYVSGTFRMMTVVEEDYATTPHTLKRGAVIGTGIESGYVFGPASEAFCIRPAVRLGSNFIPIRALRGDWPIDRPCFWRPRIRNRRHG